MTAPVREREIQTVSQKRKRRTRSRTISPLPPIVVSKLPPHEYDLDPVSISLVCPTCRTWVPIRVAETERATAKLVPHHTEPAGTEDPVRCLLGSHRLVAIDVSVAKWSRRLEQGVAETEGRRSDRVLRKPQSMPTPAVMQIVGGLVDDRTALKLHEVHVRSCATCSTTPHCADGHRIAAAAPKLVAAHVTACTACSPPEVRCARARRIAAAAPKLVRSHVTSCVTCSLTGSRCADGRRLAHLAAHTQRTAPLRRKRQTEQEEWDDKRAWALRLLHEQQWDTVARAVHESDQQRVRNVLTALRKMLLAPTKPHARPLTAWERADLETTIAVVERQMKDLTRRW
ncbi:hypothetical protein ACFYZ6_34270 [Streptomyces rubiginosohelvolus]|uniref:hypothetical protein n=1 Tax=Streptomyces rubiginosohelvolus TaxID=67362 RepID=UPI0036976A55